MKPHHNIHPESDSDQAQRPQSLLERNIDDPSHLSHKTVDVVVYNDRKIGHHKNFLGRVRIFGDSIPLSESQATVQRYLLDKRGHFSNVKVAVIIDLFSPMLYASIDAPNWLFLLTEFCLGGDFHVLLQHQSLKHFEEPTVESQWSAGDLLEKPDPKNATATACWLVAQNS
ncbi:hypothetical protein ACFX2J_011827 [Malus domestica]